MRHLARFFGILLAVAIVSAAVCLSESHAAQDTTVITDNAPIRVEPNKSARVMEYLPVGTEVRISSYPIEGGWYKIRSRTGVYGWINESFLSVNKEQSPATPSEERDVGPRPERDRKWYLRGLMGFDFIRPADLNDMFQFSDLNTGYTIGGEFGFFISPLFALAFRGEAIVKDVVAKENITLNTYNLTIRSYPMMLGLDMYFAKLPALRLSLGIFGGAAVATSFATEAINLAPPNILVLQRSVPTGLVRVNVTRPLGRILSIFMEAGYRYLRTGTVDTSGAANMQGGQIYIKNGFYQARVIDLSGPEIAAGIGIHF